MPDLAAGVESDIHVLGSGVPGHENGTSAAGENREVVSVSMVDAHYVAAILAARPHIGPALAHAVRPIHSGRQSDGLPDNGSGGEGEARLYADDKRLELQRCPHMAWVNLRGVEAMKARPEVVQQEASAGERAARGGAEQHFEKRAVALLRDEQHVLTHHRHLMRLASAWNRVLHHHFCHLHCRNCNRACQVIRRSAAVSVAC
ncbi:hypothetical protein L7F22_029465 [Adiantum nelumboides]|nr:hypothetical protein [Adiantum nelumboides]